MNPSDVPHPPRARVGVAFYPVSLSDQSATYRVLVRTLFSYNRWTRLFILLCAMTNKKAYRVLSTVWLLR